MSPSKGACCTFAGGDGTASDEGSDQVAANEYVNLDRRQSSSAIGRGIDADPGPPRGLIAVAMEVAMMDPADGDRVFVADLAA